MNIDARQIIFLGPSLNLAVAKACLPRGIFLPPIRCGDMLQALKLKPAAILIVDGYFERIPAVWHKEILYVLEQGVRVYGAASMGALRAAELCNYGMVGVGEIFLSYQTQQLEDDDEVAVLHASADEDYQVLTDALVNIRATLKHAVNNKIISAYESEVVLATAKNTHYKARVFREICINSALPTQKLEHLLDFIKQGGYINLKAEDTKLALQHLQHPNLAADTPINSSTPKTLYFRALQHFTAAKAFPYDAPALNTSEKLEAYSRLLFNTEYRRCCKEAMLMAIVYRIGLAKGISIEIANIQTKDQNGLMDISQYQDYLQKAALITKVIQQAQSYIQVHDLLIFSSKEETPDAERMQALNFNAQLYSAIIQRAEDLQLKINPKMVLKYIDAFRREKSLFTPEAFKAWMEHHHLSLETIIQKFNYFALIDFTAFRNNSDILALPHEQEFSNWYLYALHLTRLSSKLTPLIHDQEALTMLLQESIQSLTTKDVAYLNSLDFIDPSDFDSFIHTLFIPNEKFAYYG